jgi:acylphosphatase
MENLEKVMRYRILVKGRVQGVFFRDSVKQRCDELGLVGWVKNKDSDKVEVLVEGQKIFLDKLAQFCRSGVEKAQVLEVAVDKEEAIGEFKDFLVRY